MKRRLVAFGGSCIAIDHEDGPARDVVAFLLRHIPEVTAGQPWTVLRVRQAAEGPGLSLWQDEKPITRDEPAAVMAHSLMSQVCFTLAYESRGGLLLHAAAVMLDGLGIIFPGRSGAGKSTLSAQLLTQGGRYVSDELVYIAEGSRTCSGFGRPITFKAAARPLLPRLMSPGAPAAGIWRGETVDMIAPEAFGAEAWAGEVELDAIIFPSFRPGNAIEVQQLSKAMASYELMKCLANARNLAGHGLGEATRLTRSTPAYALSYGDVADAGRAIERLLAGLSGTS